LERGYNRALLIDTFFISLKILTGIFEI